jgi:hypothetical protein
VPGEGVLLDDPVVLTDLEVSAHRIAELEAALERARGTHDELIAAALDERDVTIPQIAHAANVTRARVRRLARLRFGIRRGR